MHSRPEGQGGRRVWPEGGGDHAAELPREPREKRCWGSKARGGRGRATPGAPERRGGHNG